MNLFHSFAQSFHLQVRLTSHFLRDKRDPITALLTSIRLRLTKKLANMMPQNNPKGEIAAVLILPSLTGARAPASLPAVKMPVKPGKLPARMPALPAK
jgi:hypothetical protein